MRYQLMVLTALAPLATCATGAVLGPEPVSIEFGQDAYLTDSYLTATGGTRCGPPSFAPGGTEVSASLPDGTWFRLFVIGSGTDDLSTVVLERGWDGEDAQLAMRLDGEEGIVRLREAQRRDAWGINHPWADWMRELGARARSLDCASPDDAVR